MDHAAFFAAVRARPYGGTLPQRAVDGLSALLTAFAEYGDGDRQKLAYILGTAFHESDRFKTMEEYASGAAYEGRGDLGNTQTGDGKRYKGRGFVQVTGRRNYTDWSKRLGLDLVGNPELAEQPSITARICVEGMMLGTFTGKKLSGFIGGGRLDYAGARRTVNGTDRADLIAGYAKTFDNALRAGGYGGVESVVARVAESRLPTHTEPTPAPAPVAPAPQPAPEPAPPVGGPRAKANGAGLGVVIVAPLLSVFVRFGWIPEAVASDPETIIQVTGLLLAGAAWVGAYFAPRNGAPA